MAEKNYRVVGLTKKGGMKTFSIDVLAANASDAKAIAKYEWDTVCPDAHLFHVEAKAMPRKSIHSGLWHKTGESKNGHWVDYV